MTRINMRQMLRQLTLSASLLMCCLVIVNCSGTPTTQTPTVESLSGDGIYSVERYIDLPDVPEYGDATVYYPSDKTELFGAIAISPGFTETQAPMSWWGPRLASHGFAVLTFNTNAPRDYPNIRADALMAAVGMVRGENTRTDSPLFGKLDVNKMIVMGHSMGGGGTLIAADAHGDELVAAIPFTPWQPDTQFTHITIPTLVIAGESDSIAPVANHAWPHYQSIPDSTPKAFLEFKNGNHFIGNSSRSNLDAHDVMGRYVIAWLKFYVDKDSRYEVFLEEDSADKESDVFSRFEVKK